MYYVCNTVLKMESWKLKLDVFYRDPELKITPCFFWFASTASTSIQTIFTSYKYISVFRVTCAYGRCYYRASLLQNIYLRCLNALCTPVYYGNGPGPECWGFSVFLGICLNFGNTLRIRTNTFTSHKERNVWLHETLVTFSNLKY